MKIDWKRKWIAIVFLKDGFSLEWVAAGLSLSKEFREESSL